MDRSKRCWLWKDGSGRDGYGSLYDRTKHKTVSAHRYIYELLVGPISAGLTLDHLCRHRRCVNPAHLQPVPIRENVMRGNSPTVIANRSGICKRGHSDWIRYGRQNYCRVCYRAGSKARFRKWRDGQKQKV